MDDFVFRNATIYDVPFLVDTIIEAEKSGTEKLSYSTIFGLAEDEVKKYIAAMLIEEIDYCELSISSFMVVEKNGIVAGAVSAWIEGHTGVPSAILKGNLLNYYLPKECFNKAASLNSIIREMHIDYTPNSIQIGAGYVAQEFRGNNLLGMLHNKIIERLVKFKPDVKDIYSQIFSVNIPTIKTCEKANFKVALVKESLNKEILYYLPSNKKLLMKKELQPNNL